MPKSKYSVRVDIAVKSKMANHARFLANVSIPAAERFRSAYYSALKSLEANPKLIVTPDLCFYVDLSTFIEYNIKYPMNKKIRR